MNTQLIVALDVDSKQRAQSIVNKLGPSVKFYKVGAQLFSASGPAIIRWLKKKRKKVFLDLKLHDIPNTVANAGKVQVRLGVSMLTLHAAGGQDMISACLKAVSLESERLRVKAPAVLAVTVLTSQRPKDVKRKVCQLARCALNCKIQGLVASVEEAKMLRRKFGKNFILVCPGIRLKSKNKRDQKRIATPLQVKRSGANYIVVGRPITEAQDCLGAAKEITRQINKSI